MLQRSGVILFAALAGCSSFADDEPCACCEQEPGWTPPASDAGARDVSATDVGKDVSPEVGAETLPPLPTSCPEGMVAIPGACMDVYEASREDATEESAGTSEIASSRAGVLPWQPVDLATARAACSAAGKRLCRLDEWVAGCRGPDWTTYSYGDSYRRFATASTPIAIAKVPAPGHRRVPTRTVTSKLPRRVTARAELHST